VNPSYVLAVITGESSHILNINMKLTLMRLAAMLEQGETTVLRQRSCTTKLHTATENIAVTEGRSGYRETAGRQ
jgi:hypothetical protein